MLPEIKNLRILKMWSSGRNEDKRAFWGSFKKMSEIIPGFEPYYGVHNVRFETTVRELLRNLSESRRDVMIDSAKIPEPFMHIRSGDLFYLCGEVYGLTCRRYLQEARPEERITDLIEDGRVVLGVPGLQTH